jgi:hypothetical protein
MTLDGALAIAAIPLAGWIISVEYRIGILQGIHDKVNRVDTKVDLLLSHALNRVDSSKEV